MSKKRHNKKTNKNSDIFKNDPFNAAKGFSFLSAKREDQATLSVGNHMVEKKHIDENKLTGEPSNIAAEIDFDQVMGQLGVAALDSDNEQLLRKCDVVDDDEVVENSVQEMSIEDSDEALFLSSMGQLDTVFSDNCVADDDAIDMTDGAAAEPRRMKQLRKGKVRPQATLDLHGCYRDEARKKVCHFLRNRCADGMHTVLIVTGKGNRSPNGESVLRDDIEKYLTTHASAWVVEWGRAPRQYGGAGALVVFLRSSK